MKKTITIVTSIHPDFDSRIWKHATSIASHGYEVYLICPWNEIHGKKIEGVTLLTFKPVKKRMSRLFKIPFRVVNQLRLVYKRTDIIHFHDIDLLPMMGILSLSGKTIVYDVHENYADEMLVRAWVPSIIRYPLHYLIFFGEKLFSLLVRNIVLVAPSQEKNFSAKRLNVVYVKNYASEKLSSEIKDNYMKRDDAVIFIGSQHENNGSLLYLEIIQKVVSKNSNILFYASDRFGDPKFKQKYQKIIEEKGISKNIKLLPNVRPHEIPSILNKATIGINPNLRVAQQINGIHTKIFEFMALGLPIISSDLPHQVEVLNKCGSGILASPDNTQTFVDAILDLVGDKSRSKSIGDAGKNCFKNHYSWESQMPNLVSFYEKLT